MKRKPGDPLEARAGVVLLKAALLLRSGEEKRPQTALRAALREAGMTLPALRRALGPRAKSLGTLVAPRRRRRLSHPMR